MKLNIYFYQKIIFILLFLVFSWFNVCLAQDTLLQNTSGQNCDCQVDHSKEPANSVCKQYCGDYQLDDFVSLLIRGAQILLSVVGSLVLLMLVYGGVMFLISAGNRETVDKAKKIITGSIIGLLVVFLSYTIVGFTAKALGVQANIFQAGWLNNKK
jgi:ABC-type dipeptide/oligopeptide/nickel transport system permease subunit